MQGHLVGVWRPIGAPCRRWIAACRQPTNADHPMWTDRGGLRGRFSEGLGVSRRVADGGRRYDGHMYDAALVDDLDRQWSEWGRRHALPEEMEIQAPGGRLGAMLAGVGDRSVLDGSDLVM